MIVPPETPAAQHFIVLAALAPQRLGFDPAEASTFQALPRALKVRLGSGARVFAKPSSMTQACMASLTVLLDFSNPHIQLPANSAAQELLAQATSKQPALLRYLKATLTRMAQDQGSEMGRVIRDAGGGSDAGSATTATLLQVLCRQQHSLMCTV